jgi:mono/diheme cytochrome c family protein
MTKTEALLFSTVVAVSLAGPAYAADPDKGETLARRWCSSCHVVGSNQQSVVNEAPPFASIARQPGFDASKIAFFLLAPHPKMPDMGLSRSEAADIAAYISRLK